MRVLVVEAHPNPDSYVAALGCMVRTTLAERGCHVDGLDLYAEEFDPVLSLSERLAYHDPASNVVPVGAHVDRLRAAEALVLVYPVWNFGFPAILKGWFDRVFLPGVSFRIVNGVVRPNLQNIRAIGAVATYGARRLTAWSLGDAPRLFVTRTLPRLAAPGTQVLYLGRYDMNRIGTSERERFLARVRFRFSTFALA